MDNKMHFHLAKVENDVITEYPLSEDTLSKDAPNYSSSKDESEFEGTGIVKVDIPPNYIVDGYSYIPANPQLVDDKWVATYVRDEETPVELIQLRTKNAANARRKDRDILIQMAQARVERYNRFARLGKPQVDNIEELDTYIQALADLPEQEGFPFTVNFPVAP